MSKAYFHLPGLFEFHELYGIFIPLFYEEHREWFYEWCDIGSIYGSPGDALWGGGRAGFGLGGIEKDVLHLTERYGISARLAFSNSLLEDQHLSDPDCNRLCRVFENGRNGIIVHSDLLLNHIRKNFPEFYFVSSTTKVLTEFDEFKRELGRSEFKFVVPDFRLNKSFDSLKSLSDSEKKKVEFLCNECCWFQCGARKKCYEYVSRKVLGLDAEDWVCASPDSAEGYVFSKAMKNPGFIGVNDIRDVYLPLGFSNFKIEGRSLGSALVLEFLLYYMTKPEFQLNVREKIYLDNSLDLF